LAFEINHKAVENIAKISERNNKKLIHISTDYVFDGEACKPYSENDQPNPINIYGESKLKGENSIVDILPRNYLILRTSWLYSIEKGSFLTKIIDLLKSNEIIKVVNDQTGTPTSCDSLSKIIYLSIMQNLSGLYNFSDNGYTTWHDFANSIKENILKLGFLEKVAKITPVTTEDYGAKARRPLYSVLDKEKILGELEFDHLHWEDALRNEINRLKETQIYE
jgi:dTDP-4-dehydrorhamnose reductase